MIAARAAGQVTPSELEAALERALAEPRLVAYIAGAATHNWRAAQRVASIWLVAGDRPPRLVSTWDIP